MRQFSLFLLITLLGGIGPVFGQKVTINGYVRDSLSGESIIGAQVAGGGRTVATNAYGYYSLTLDTGMQVLTVSHVAYLSASFTVDLQANQEKNLLLLPRTAGLSEVRVYSRRKDENVRSAQMGRIDLSMNQIRNVPAFLGEVDILKAIQLLPGVQSAGEGNSGFYVRGGGPDQNLIVLDDAVVYNTGHLFSFFSIFNADAIKNTSLIKGGMPAQYGGRLSSVLDVTMKDGNNQNFSAEGGIGLIASRLSLQGPLVKDKASFIVSARRTYIDVLARPFIKKESNAYGSGYYFYDLNAKVNYRISNKDRLYLSGYFGRDVFRYRDRKLAFRADIPWGNSTATLRWNHVFNQKLFANTSLVYNDYKFSFGAAQNNFEVTLNSGIRDYTLKTDFDYYPSGSHRLKFGLLATYHRFTPNVASGRQDTQVFRPNNIAIRYALENALYLQDDWDISEKLKAAVGLRWSRFSQVGPYTRYVRDANQNPVDSTVYKGFESVATYQGFEPRVSLRWAVDARTAIKASVTRNQQFIHLVSNSGTTLPTDLWVPSTFRVRPQLSWQYAAGLFRNFRDNEIETSLEVYYKRMDNQIEYEEGYTDNQLMDAEESFVFGKGWSYGAELLVNKTRGQLTGWIGYTLSWTWRQFPEINSGLRYPAKYDRRHDLSIVANYELSPRWKLGAVFVYGTGNSTSLPERFYVINGVLTQEYSAINKYRLPPYHRMDLSATYTPKQKPRRMQSHWVFSIYNLYNRMNPYFIYFDQTGSPYNGTLQIQAKQVSLFPILPSVTWNFRF
jgi:hypothetical protein